MKFSLGNGNGDYVIILYDEEEKEYFFKYKGERFSAKTEKELHDICYHIPPVVVTDLKCL